MIYQKDNHYHSRAIMLNGTSNLHWSRTPIILYDRSALSQQDGPRSRLCADDDTARFAGAFSIRSILSQSRPQGDMSTVQEPRYMTRVPGASCTYEQPQVVCCNEETMSPIHLQATVNALNQGGSMGSFREAGRSCVEMPSYETTKQSGCLGVQSSIAKARPRRANKRSRTIFTPYQLQRLEKAFDRQQYVAGEERRQLAVGLNLSETQVKVWFQNRRIRFRKQRVKTNIS